MHKHQSDDRIDKHRWLEKESKRPFQVSKRPKI